MLYTIRSSAGRMSKVGEQENLNRDNEMQEENLQEEGRQGEEQQQEADGAQESLEEAPDNPEEAQEEEADAGEDIKGHKKKFKKQLADLKAKNEELEDKVKRQMAEFDNFRKRTEKEKSGMFELGAKSVIEKILPVIDNFERGLDSVPEEEKDGPFAEGMNMIYRQLMTELEGLGVKTIEALGNEFDPNLHNAVMQVESEEYDSGIVAQELQKGYMYRDSVVRHSMVGVVQ